VIDKDAVLQRINIGTEVSNLLGQPKHGKYRCFRRDAHSQGDANPSLTMNDRGYWKCHTCAIGGDFFQLYMDVKGLPSERFHEVLNHFARQYGIDMNPTVRVEKKKQNLKQRAVIGMRKAKQLINSPARDILSPRYGALCADWLRECYGISDETIRDFSLGWSTSSKRLFIPIPVSGLWKNKEKREYDDILNVRKHDILRYHVGWYELEEDGSLAKDETGSQIKQDKRPAAVQRIRGQWVYGNFKPVWERNRGGKVIGVKGHNSVYLYPMSSINKPGTIWIVGGELKALLLIQHGINAVTFTCGEGNFSNDLLPLFNGKEVKVLYDIDDAGQRGSMNIGQALANAGAIVKVGKIPADGLPGNGDVTDYMRINQWDISCLNRITWSAIAPKTAPKQSLTEKKEIKFKQKSFSSLVDGELLSQYIEVPAIISGRGVTPYAVPTAIAIDCPTGRRDQLKKCAGCSIARTGFQTPGYPNKFPLDGEHVVDMTGVSKREIPSRLRDLMGITRKCAAPKLKIDYATVEKIILVPTVDVKEEADQEYRHHQVYLITDGKKGPKENEGYMVGGKMVGAPKDNAFTMAALQTQPIDGNVFSYKRSNEMHAKLHESLWTNCSNSGDVFRRLIKDLAENVLFKYGVDMMIGVEVISWFMPFTFSISPQYKCKKVCSEVLIVGDTRVGKSTTAQDLAVHFGAGRYVDCGSNATFVGLVGGNTELGSHRVFTWGVLPTSNRGHVTLDEANKLRLEVWSGLTNLKSSGVAERTTNAGPRKTRSAVRLLTLCNPRGNRPLGAYDTPLDAAIEVVGSPQDLARVDLLYVAWGTKEIGLINTIHKSTTPHTYTREISRYHLQWAWSLDESKIRFASAEHVLARASELSEATQGISLVAVTESKFKVGRIAIAIASITYSYDDKTGGVLVNNEHVDAAYNLLLKLYTDYLKNAGIKTGVLPADVKSLFDKVPNPKKLRILSTSDDWSNADFSEIFGDKSGEFKYLAQLEHGLMTRRRSYFIPVEGFKDLIRDYVNVRIKGKR